MRVTTITSHVAAIRFTFYGFPARQCRRRYFFAAVHPLRLSVRSLVRPFVRSDIISNKCPKGDLRH